MATQRSEVIEAGRVKNMLEELTDNKYVLKTRAELVNPDNMTWYLHVPVGTPCQIADVYEADGKLVFESQIVYDVFQDMEHRFSESKYVQLREKLGDDVNILHGRSVRQNYRKMIPSVVLFFDKAEEILSKINRERMTSLSLVNDSGWITINAEPETRRVEKDESLIKKNILAMQEALRQIGEWMDEQRD